MLSIILSALIMLTPAQRDSILSQHPDNAAFWEEIFREYSGDTLEYADYLFLSMPEADRDSMNLSIITDHLMGALSTRDIWYSSLPDSVFLPYLLQYRIADEPLSSYRSALQAWLQRRMEEKATPLETAQSILSVVMTNIRAVASSGNAPLTPTQIIPIGQASREGRWILLCSAMRSMGIPVRPVKGWFPGTDRNLYRWEEIWDGSQWQPLTEGMPPLQYVKVAVEYPDMRNITGRYRDTGTLVTEPITDQNPGWEAELMIPSGDDTVSITGIHIDPFQSSNVELGAGEFILRVRFMQGGQLIGTSLQNITITQGETSVVYLTEAQYDIVPLPR